MTKQAEGGGQEVGQERHRAERHNFTGWVGYERSAGRLSSLLPNLFSPSFPPIHSFLILQVRNNNPSPVWKPMGGRHPAAVQRGRDTPAQAAGVKRSVWNVCGMNGKLGRGRGWQGEPICVGGGKRRWFFG